MNIRAAFVGLLLLTAVSPAAANEGTGRGSGAAGLVNDTILIIRHSEKPASGPGLNAAGEARAQAYATYFRSFSLDGSALRIDALIATADSAESNREKLTLEPLSRVTHLPIQQPFDNNGASDLAKWLRQGLPNRNILIAWHRGKIPKIIAALGLDPAAVLPGGRWPEDVYDWLVVLRFDENGDVAPASCRLIHEPILSNAP